MTYNINNYKDRGLSGLANLGNTCYINSTMQIISHCYIFNDLLDKLSKTDMNNSNDSVLLLEWKNLKDILWSKNCTISPNRFINFVHEISKQKNIVLFSGFAQNDLPEFLIFIINCFHEALKRKVEMKISGKVYNETDILAKECFTMIKNMYSETYSELLNIFYGIHVSQIYSENMKNILSAKAEPYCIIDLPFPKNTQSCSIYDCFDLYTEKEFLKDDNAWFNEKTKNKENVYKSIMFWSLPKILIVDFKKFDNNNKKINITIDSPLTNVDFSKYIVGYDKNSYVYSLFAICNHSGGSLGGHYTSYIKNANEKWYEFYF